MFTSHSLRLLLLTHGPQVVAHLAGTTELSEQDIWDIALMHDDLEVVESPVLRFTTASPAAVSGDGGPTASAT